VASFIFAGVIAASAVELVASESYGLIVGFVLAVALVAWVFSSYVIGHNLIAGALSLRPRLPFFQRGPAGAKPSVAA